jgi:hypothetical protein
MSRWGFVVSPRDYAYGHFTTEHLLRSTRLPKILTTFPACTLPFDDNDMNY